MNEQNDQNKDNMLDDRQQIVPAENEDNTLYTMPDVYRAQSSQDIYQVPETTPEPYNTGGVFSGEQPAYYAYDNAQYNRNTYDGNTGYGNNQYTESQYGSGRYDYNQYGGNQYNNNPIENGQYGGNQYGNNPIENGQYGGNQYGNNPIGNGQYSGNQYGKNPNEIGQYNGNQYGNNQYGNSQYGNNQYNAPYGADQYYNNNPYSPYAVPPKKKHTGLIIGVIITVAVLFLIALFALIYHALEIVADKKEEVYKEIQNNYDNDHDDQDSYHDFKNDDNRDNNRDNDNHDDRDDDHNDNHDDDHDNDHDYDNDDDYDYDSDEYYTLHDDIKKLSYSIDWEYFEYDTDDENVFIMVDYPVIVGDHIPNLDKINEAIAEEVSVFTEYYEEEYSDYMFDDDSYFNAYAAGYVTYMSEDILSVVFSEYVYTDYYDSVYLYCINIDVQDGVILDNTDLISVDDDFSVDFRYRSNEQNGPISGLDSMTDQEITELLTSFDSLIIFYTPQGMEIGVNYSEGWVTVTYHDYKDYLKIF